MTARSQARADDAHYADDGGAAHELGLGDRVRCSCGEGVIEFVAYSHSMQARVYTVAIDTRIKLRVLGRDLTLVRKAA